MRCALIALVLVSPSALAGPVPCGYEPTERSRAHCLDVLTETVRMRIDADIAASTVDLMGLRARALGALERDLRRSQRAWGRETDRACRAEAADPVGRATCRLRETVERRHALRGELDEMRASLGMAPLVPVPDEFEILVPLPPPPAGPYAEPYLWFDVPLRAD